MPPPPLQQTLGGDTALHIACFKGFFGAAKQLVDVGADTSLRNDSGLTAADTAANKGHGQLAGWLSRQAL